MGQPNLIKLLFSLLALGLVPPASAQEPTETAANIAARTAFLARLSKEQQLQNIGWKLIQGNAEFCENIIPAVGLQLHDIASYENPDIVRIAAGLEGDIGVLTVAAGSPGHRAGLRHGQEIVDVAGFDPTTISVASRNDWRRAKQLHDKIDASLISDHSVTLTLLENSEVTIDPVMTCSTRFELGGDNARAVADGNRVIFGSRFPGFNYDEEEFAAAVAHEFAHNVMQHRSWLAKAGRHRRNIRITEREADRLMPWLLVNAGYDPMAAVRFMARWGPKHGGGLFRKRTHDGWDERVEFIENEVARINSSQPVGQKLNWRILFEREPELTRY